MSFLYSETTEYSGGSPTHDELFAMANLFPKQTGLPFVVWISAKAMARHDVRVKISPRPKAVGEWISVAIRPTIRIVEGGQIKGQDFALLKHWITLNYEVILDYWNKEIDTMEAMAQIRSITGESR